MADLVARPAWAGLDLPFAAGGATLAALPDERLRVVAPFRGRAEAVAAALGAWPEPGRAVATGGGRLVWSGIDQAMLAGEGPGDVEGRLAGLAAVTEVSDGWTGLALIGPGAVHVLARLVPIDLAPAAFPKGAVARSQLRHVACLIAAAPGGFEIRVMRSFTTTAAGEIMEAMRALAARAALAALA